MRNGAGKTDRIGMGRGPRGKRYGRGHGLGRGMMRQLHRAQETEMTEHVIYTWLAKKAKKENNRKLLHHIAQDEKRHAEFWKEYTNTAVQPKSSTIFFHKIMARLFGFTFSVKLMEKGEKAAQVNYQEIAREIPEAAQIQKEEDAHEHKLLDLLDEEKLKYIGSMVLGVNDALVELTGTLAGLTLAIQNARLIAAIGLITGIAASLSMGTSEYLSTKAEEQDKDPVKASLYTGAMYLVTVILLIVPFYVFSNVFISLGITLAIAILIIFFFTFYISIAQDVPFKKRFLEMAGISLGVATLTFIIGYFVRRFFGVNI